jgi:hypothetical protein
MDVRMGQIETLKKRIIETSSMPSDSPQTGEAGGAAGGETSGQTGIDVSTQVQSNSQWYQSVLYGGQDAVLMTDQFRLELQKIRQMAASILEALNNMMGDGCSCRFSKLDQVFAMPVNRAESGTYVSWEHTRTQASVYEESELTLVSAEGMIRTEDNREIDFTFDFEMERSFLSEELFAWSESGYALLDPLVIRTDVSAPLLSGTQFSFDLDLDGEMEDLPMPGPGMAFLALDLNKDGIINDGSELFGPSTGDGFGELAAYDLDGNDWIDENDDIFDELTLWESEESGGMQLTSLKDAGIGAVYLAGVNSPFDLKTEDNELWGKVSKTSIALTEEGEILPVQEVNYTV